MRIIVFFIQILIITSKLHAQDTLYYFQSEETALVGVRSHKGKVIVLPIFEEGAKKYNYNKAISEETIEFHLLPKGEKVDFSPVAVPLGAVYSRVGEFLYHPFYEDNGTDYWREDVRRYVENGKVGFVDKSGRKLTPAKWDYAGWFNYGYAQVYHGNLKKVYDKGGEHWTLGSDGHVETYLIDKNGDRAIPSNERKHPKDYFYEGKYYPYPFSYTKEEQEILDKLNKDSIALGLRYIDNYNIREYPSNAIQIEIIEKPSLERTYYVVSVFYNSENIDSGLDIYVDSMTKNSSFNANFDNTYIPLRFDLIKSLTRFLEKNDIHTETREIVEKELQRLQRNH